MDKSTAYWKEQAERTAILLEQANIKLEGYAQRVADAEQTLRKLGAQRALALKAPPVDERFRVILNAAAEACGITADIILSERQDKDAADPRQIACLLMSEAGLKLRFIGSMLNRDHTTARLAAKTARQKAQNDPTFARRLRVARDLVAHLLPEDTHADLISS